MKSFVLIIYLLFNLRQSSNPADCCSVLIKTEEGENEDNDDVDDIDVDGIESNHGADCNSKHSSHAVNSSNNNENASSNREHSVEPPRRRDSSDPVNLSLNSAASVTSDQSLNHDASTGNRLDEKYSNGESRASGVLHSYRRSEKEQLDRRESIDEADEKRRQLQTRMVLGLVETNKRKSDELPTPSSESYVVGPHRKRKPGFHNAPAQNPPFVPFNPGFETSRRLQAPHAALSASAPPYSVRYIILKVIPHLLVKSNVNL